MDDKAREELETIRKRQRALGEELRSISEKHQELLRDIERFEEVGETEAAEAVNLPPAPPPLPSASELKPTVGKEEKVYDRVKKPAAPALAKTPEKKPERAIFSPPEPDEVVAREKKNTGEWELNFGRVWLVRIGVLLLLTGLIFLSTYAYKNWLFNAGAGVKVVFFMTISLTLTGVGIWLDVWKERFRQYGRVVASGGLAAGYYTIYAAHFVESLKVVSNPVLAAVLLTLWAGLMLAYAVWKKSRVVAVMAIGLAFYGTIVNPSGWLSLFSALLLSASGIWLMLRFRWIGIGLGTVAAAYASHVFWLDWYPGSVAEGVRLSYLASYWLLFTVAMMVPQARELPEKIQRAITAINNSAAWFLTVFSLPLLQPHAQIGWISLGVGVGWLGLAAVARSGKLWHKSLAVIFGYQGLMIATLGLLIESTGYTRFLVLAVEACVLLLGARQFGGVLARAASVITFAAALIAALPEANGNEPASWLAYAALALVCGVYTVLVKVDRRDQEQDFVAILPAVVMWLVLMLGVFSQWSDAASVNGVWVTLLVVLLGYEYVPKWRKLPGLLELVVLAVPVSLVACWWYVEAHAGMGIWQSVVPLLGVLTFWWHCPRFLTIWQDYSKDASGRPTPALEWLFAIVFWVLLGSTATVHMPHEAWWLVLGGVLALLGHGAAEWTGRKSIGGPPLVFHLSAVGCVISWGQEYPVGAWLPAMLLLLHMLLVSLRWRGMGQSVLLGLMAFAFSSAVALHAHQQLARPEWLLVLVAVLMGGWAYHRRDVLHLFAGCVFPIGLSCVTVMVNSGLTDWFRYVPVAAALGLHAVLWCRTKDESKWKACRVCLLVVGLVTLAFSASMHVLVAFDGAGLAICWALLASALFCAGLAIRCRAYRLIGLWWLGAAVLHVVCIDVMRLETLGRILSFITLGLVLLALGFLYNKFQETIRKFL